MRVNNDTYLVFRAMELASRCVVNVERVASHPTVKIQEEMQSSIMNDPSVTAHWNYLLTKAEAFDTDEYDELLGRLLINGSKSVATRLQLGGLNNIS